MKKIFLPLFLIAYFNAFAITHVVSISNFQFSPANLNVVVGDVIRWEWAGGFHNSVSITVPLGAAAWMSPSTSSVGNTYDYTVTTQGTYTYYCTIHGTGMSGTFTASAVVPVTLSSFLVSSRQKSPYLTWTTQQESNSDYFGIRRSYDGIIFTEIGRVPAAGLSNVEKNYFFIDVSVNRNVKYVYYELAITDRDASKQLSPIKLFKNNENLKKLILSISPNPVQNAGHLLITFNADAEATLMAKINDMSGKLVLAAELFANPGVNNGHIHLGELAAGIYVIHFNLNGITETYKIRKK